MKLSDAIREGIKQRPVQLTDGLYFDKAGVACCVLGAALIGIGKDTPNKVPSYDDDAGAVPLEDIWAEMATVVHCPHPTCNNEYGSNLFYIVGEHLNDTHGWTREQIADWLAEQGY